MHDLIIMNKGRIVVKGDLSNIILGTETLEDAFIRHVEDKTRQDE